MTILDAVEPRSFVTLKDFPEIKPSALTRILREEVRTGNLTRIRPGVYYKGVHTRYGMTRPDQLEILNHILDGSTTYGLAGWSATNQIGISTQLPARMHIAITGAKRPSVQGIVFTNRSNHLRNDLTFSEITVMEAMRGFEKYSDYGWDKSVDLIAREINYWISKDPSSLSLERLSYAVSGETDRTTRDNFSKLYSALS